MKIIQSGINTLHVSNSILREFRNLDSFRDWSLDDFADYFVRRAYRTLGVGENTEGIDKFLDFCRDYSNKKEDFKVGILNAHGTYVFGRWCYRDGFVPKSVQGWIDKYDGIYDLLLLPVCNPRKTKPIIIKSMAIVPTDYVGPLWNKDAGIEHLVVMPNR